MNITLHFDGMHDISDSEINGLRRAVQLFIAEASKVTDKLTGVTDLHIKGLRKEETPC